jgi:hypothetical protein
MTGRKIKGIYQRGNIFWLTHGSGKHRLQESLKTSDYADAVAKAKEILNQPLLNTTTGFKPDLDDYAENQTKNCSATFKATCSATAMACMARWHRKMPV